MIKENNNFIKKFISNNKYILIILAVSFMIRVWGVNFGLPYLYNPDEPIFTKKAINFFTGDFNPHWFGHPGSFLINILFLLYGIYFLIGLIFGHFSNISGFINLFKNNPTTFYLLGRFTTVFFGTLSIYILYKIINKLFQNKYSLISAIILGVAPLHVYHSKLIRTDITQTMLILFALYYFINYIELKRKTDIFVGSMFFGFSIATKWPSFILIIPFLITLFVIEKENLKMKINKNNLLYILMILIIGILFSISLFLLINKNNIINPFIIRFFTNKNFNAHAISKLISIINLLLYFFTAVLSVLIICFTLANFNIHIFKIFINTTYNLIYGRIFLISLFIVFLSFFIMAPFVFFDFFKFVKSFIIESRSSHIGFDGLGFIGNILFYLKEPFNVDFGGIGIEILSFVGIVFLLKDWKKLDRRHLIFFSFPFFYFLSISRLPLHWRRYVIPVLPFLAILSAIGLIDFLNIFIKHKSYRTTILILVLFPLLYVPIKESILKDYELSHKDTRTVAKEWIEANLPKNSVVAYEHYAPHLHIRPREDLVLYNLEWTRIVYNPLNDYINKKIDYIIITNIFKKHFFREPERYKMLVERYKDLEARCEKFKTFKPAKFQSGPEITIYKLPKSG